MALAMVVKRNAGDKIGQDVIDPLITLVNVGLSRGRAELDQQASNLQTVNVQTVFRSGVKSGQLAEFNDNLQGETWKGKIIGVTHIMDNLTLVSRLTVLRPRT